MTNFAARVGALAALTIASLVVARLGGPAAVGTFALLRVLPWVVGVLMSFGLFGAVPYFLAGDARAERRYRPTIFTIAIISGGIGGMLWVALTPVIAPFFFPNLSLALVALAGVTVLTQELESTAKASSQGFGDLPGANRVIVLEELLFLPCFGSLLALGVEIEVALVLGLAFGDLLTLSPAWIRLARRGFFRDAGHPSFSLARRVIAFGLRAEVGTLVLLLNARLDFAIVGAIVGPAELGVYAIASRFAELLRLPPLAVNYVLYPDFASRGTSAAVRARRLIPTVGVVTAAAALPLGLAAIVVIPVLYGPAFKEAVAPTMVLLIGLSAGGVAGVITAFLYADGRPGLNSLAQIAGLVVTLVLDLTLIPRFGVMGAAWASTMAYLTTAIFLVGCFAALNRSRLVSMDVSDTSDERTLTEVNR
jgi:O-antigen/teichoic acid export membrane protein